MTGNTQNKTDSTPKTDTDTQARIDFWQAARVVGGTILAAVVLVGPAVAKALSGRKPSGP